jgi:hypothetical protein
LAKDLIFIFQDSLDLFPADKGEIFQGRLAEQAAFDGPVELDG